MQAATGLAASPLQVREFHQTSVTWENKKQRVRAQPKNYIRAQKLKLTVMENESAEGDVS